MVEGIWKLHQIFVTTGHTVLDFLHHFIQPKGKNSFNSIDTKGQSKDKEWSSL